MIQTFSCRGSDKGRALDPGVSELPAGTMWVDVSEPGQSEAELLARVADVALPSREQLSEVESSSRLRSLDGALYLAIPVVTKSKGEQARTTPFGLILTRDRLVTVRFEELRAIDAFRERLSRGEITDPGPVGVAVALLESIVDRLADVLEEVGADLDGVTQRIFGSGGETAGGHTAKKAQDARLRATLREVGRYRQLVSKVRATLLAIGRAVPFVETEAHDWVPERTREPLAQLKADVASLDEYEVHLSDKAQFVLDAALGLISIEQNDTFRVLTLVSVVGIPPTLVASMYGMNFKHMPELEWLYGYPYGLALIAASAIIPLVYFRARGWF